MESSGQTPPTSLRRTNAARVHETSTHENSSARIEGTQATIPTSVVDLLRAQHHDDDADNQESSSGSSNAMPMTRSQTRAKEAVPSVCAQERKNVADASTVDNAQKKGASTDSALDSWQLRHSTSTTRSEQDRYNYSALPPVGDSPTSRHMAQNTTAETKAAQATRTPSEAPRNKLSSFHLSRKQMPVQTTALVHPSTSSSSSSEGAPEDAAKPQNTVKATTLTPFSAGVILGVRQPISVQALTNPSLSAATPASVYGPGSGPIAATMPSRGGLADRVSPSRAVDSDASESTSSSNDNADLRHPPPHQTAETHHLDSSFHNYFDRALSRPPSQDARSYPSQPLFLDPSASRSQDACSSSAFSLRYSTHRSPRQQDMEASPLPSQLLSHSRKTRKLAQNVSITPSLVGPQDPITAGGYYYGYDCGSESTSQPSMVSLPIAEA
ncbi:hypothetical protein JKF63_00851 [Porcisia hertigi]|uniref:Uncharacterized protein n=1 Tax=Porcisia hertigi TaxID=2761500 RepID=A0A836KXJ6_9TRYP|nr:hypothetical protein JKF63_00851 [Porcisia hertigi]